MFDLPKLRMAVTEHRVECRRCTCGAETAGRFPKQVRAPAQYGPGIRALGCYLLVHQHLPIDRAAQLLADVLGAPVAIGPSTSAARHWRPGFITTTTTGRTPPAPTSRPSRD